MARGRNAAVIVFLVASVHKWPALTEVLAKIDMILPLQEAQNDYRSSFVILLCRYRWRDHRESLRMATGCPLRALHQAEGLEQVGFVPAIRSRSAPSALARVTSRATAVLDLPLLVAVSTVKLSTLSQLGKPLPGRARPRRFSFPDASLRMRLCASKSASPAAPASDNGVLTA